MSDNSQGGGAGQIPTTFALKYRRFNRIFIPAKNKIKISSINHLFLN
ncbi:hypothetical protein PROVALCAL_00777 [Providencia alcalifaciens DSM 30120]|uniref:Uncharacterized protein n=1 Tax=Providencia alcalifaciens DSM 30120 TaxID=520999 RepID=B6XBR6_9GAMM|nr:hypothetical protein PROVALCAL_00777 [Providencia alcalifaciens DSM 30120]